MNTSDVSMKPELTKALITAALFFLPIALPARPAGEGDSYWGTVHSLKGFGASLEYPHKSRGFNVITAYFDIYGIPSLKTSTPGFRVSFLHNLDLVQGSLKDGDATWSLYAGMGAMAGYLTENNLRNGLATGLTGDVGVRFLFPSSFAVSLYFQGDLAVHLKMDQGLTMTTYRNGLYRAWIPILCISYNF